MTVKIQTYYDRYHTDKAVSFDPNSSLTDQDYKSMTDVNYLLSHMAGHSRTPLYGVQDNSTFEDWSNEMALVKRKFMDLSPEVQGSFGNAQNFLKWCADPNNYTSELPKIKEYVANLEESKKKQEKSDLKETKFAEKIARAIKGE